ncbi:MAG: RadC family protein [Clostridia bacterium]|nr:RadC family protein [Clostridia bacterium]
MSQHNDGHRQRLRERMLQEGLQSFQDHEVLELLLFQYIPRKDTNKLAHALLDKFGSIYNILNAPPEQLMTVDGISKVTACNLSMLKEVLQRYIHGQVSRQKFVGVNSIIDFARLLISNAYVEQLVVVYVDNTTTHLFHEIYSNNNTGNVNVDVKKMVATAVRVGANGVVVAHCHPNGECYPSDADIKFTRNLFFALGSLDIVVLDHIIFNGDPGYYSMYDKGIMKQIQSDYCKFLLK